MLGLGLIALAAVLVQTSTDVRPPRPTDEQMFAELRVERPTARILSQSSLNGGLGSRQVCGLMDIDGAIEPFSLMTYWQDAEPSRIIIAGFPPSEAKPAEWRISANGPRAADWDGDGQVKVLDRNMNSNYRRMALALCQDRNAITPPEGVNWVLTSEPDPDRRRGPRPGYEHIPPLPIPPVPAPSKSD
ncbi:hypothetical protein ASC65_05125 [Brevundimonas sp. Root1279]|nr:hypothetical protein ASC65_05125 [Brevundimonas sp. Root1279]